MPTVLQRAMLTPATPGILSQLGAGGFLGGFDSWSGSSLPVYPGGPSTSSGQDGYSWDTKNAASSYGLFNWTGDKCQLELWLYLAQAPGTQFGGNSGVFMAGSRLGTGGPFDYFNVGVDSSLNLRLGVWQDPTYGGAPAIISTPLSLYHRYRFIAALVGINSNWKFQLRIQDLSVDATPRTLFTSATAAINGGKPMDTLKVGTSSSVPLLGRLGGVVKSSLSAADFSDVAFDSAVYIPPVGTQRDWYVDDAGSDLNDGSAGHPIKTIAELSSRAQQGYLFGAIDALVDQNGGAIAVGALNRRQLDNRVRNGTALFNGDRLHLNVAGHEMSANLVLAKCPGLKVLGNGSAFRGTRILSGPGAGSPVTWTLESGVVWKQSTSVQADVAVWEDERPMEHPPQGTVTSSAAISYLQAHPGSFWTDGTSLWIRAGDSSNPNTNGRKYERSYKYNNDLAAILFAYACPIYIEDLLLEGYALLQNDNSGGPVQGRGLLGDNPGMSGYAFLRNIRFARWGKHAFSVGDAATSTCAVLRGWTLEKGGPPTSYFGFGEQSGLVLAPQSGTGREFLFADGTVLATEGIVPAQAGSAAGAITTSQPAFLTHGAGNQELETPEFAAIEFDNCDFRGAVVSVGDQTYTRPNLIFTGCTNFLFSPDIKSAQITIAGSSGSASLSTGVFFKGRG